MSIIIGCLGAIYQDNLKRFAAYTSINQVGFLLIGLSTISVVGFSAALLNLFFYSLANLGFFTILLNAKQKETGNNLFMINQLRDFAITNPKQAYIFMFLIFSMAGIPPFIGFFGKFLIFLSTDFMFVFTLVVGLLATVISAFYYVRLIKVCFFDFTFSSC